MAFDNALYDKWAIVGAAIITMGSLVFIAGTKNPLGWLIVSAAWVYAAVIELFRGPNGYEKGGLALIFLALALGALGTYTAYRREEAGEEVSL